MNCNECLEDLIALLEGLLDPEKSMALQAHLENCAACRAEHSALFQLRRQLIALAKKNGKSSKAKSEATE